MLTVVKMVVMVLVTRSSVRNNGKLLVESLHL